MKVYINDKFNTDDIYVYASGFTGADGYEYNLQSLKGVEYVDFQAEVYNPTGNRHTVYLVLAKFHNGDLQDVHIATDVAEVTESMIDTVEVPWFDVRSYGEGDVLKGYVFKDMNGIEPLVSCSAFGTVSYDGRDGWCKEPVVSLSETKEQMVINGEWEYMPAYGSCKFSTSAANDSNWGRIWVPGIWEFNWNSHMDNYTAASGDMWAEYLGDGQYLSAGKNTDAMWYRRKINIPESWSNKKIQVDFERVGTVGMVYVDDVEKGAVKWPGGSVDITGVTPGEHMLKVLVVAAADKAAFTSSEDDVITAWRNNDSSYVVNKLDGAAVGIVDDVMITATNKTDLLTGVFVQTSVENETLTLDLEFEDISKDQNASVTVDIIDYATKEKVDTLSSSVNLTQGSCKETVSFNYITPKLWDYKQPNLYLCDIKVNGETINDNLVERFGFREFKINGRGFTLNGTPIRLRVYGHDTDFSEGVITWEKKRLLSQIENGANIIEIWPTCSFAKGSFDFRDQVADIADEIGLMIMMPTIQTDSFTWWGGNIAGDRGVKWRAALETEWKKMRNNPSVVINVGSGNRFGNGDVLNPRRIGNYNNLKSKQPWYLEQQPIADEVFAAIKELDPTRPAMAHHGGNAGDIHSTNIYLTFVPLQEREEWISEWSKNGDMPYSAIEYGTPLNFSFGGSRDQNEGLGRRSQALGTEFANIYLGNDAYLTEHQAYKDLIKSSFAPSTSNPEGYNLCDAELNKLDSFKKVQALFSKNTYRSWRTYGISGGMLPWDEGYFWEGVPSNWGAAAPIEGFKPGDKGVYPLGANRSAYAVSSNKAFLSSVGKTAIANIQETLAYIGGYPDFVSKEHHYFSGTKMRKKVVLINDSRNERPYTVILSDGNGTTKSFNGTLNVGEIKFVNVEFDLPTVSQNTTKTMSLTAAIGGVISEDTFEYTIYPTVTTSGKNVYVYDTVGDTTNLLIENGYATTSYTDQTLTANDILVIGRKSLGSFDYEAVANTGAKVIIFGQDMDTLKTRFGFRSLDVVARRFWPIDNTGSALTSGLNGEDFRDWNGAGTLAPIEAGTDIATNEIAMAADNFSADTIGYHWKNTGSVSGYIIDKPDNSNWMPLIEGEFDMNYTALMQNDNVLYCGLDLENRGAIEPMVKIMLQRMLESDWGQKKSKPNVYFMGSNSSYLDGIGLSYTALNNNKNTTVENGVLIIDSGCDLNENTLKSYVNNGNTVISLGKAFNGASITNGTYNGSLTALSGTEFAGITISDTRTRTSIDNFPLITTAPSGGQILSNGFIAAYTGSNGGKAIIFSALPSQIDTASLAYLRYTQWHMQYAVSRVISNAGGQFKGNDKLYYPGYIEKDYKGTININGTDVETTIDSDDFSRFHCW